MRQYSFLDAVIKEVDTGLRTLGGAMVSQRQNPADKVSHGSLSEKEKKQVVGFMRVNHSGEVAAQALYQGQALTTKSRTLQNTLRQSAEEEVDHLAWCQWRLQSLGSAPSVLAPLWYGGSFCLGALAGWCGDSWGLGFVAETEHQVTAHLDKHLKALPPQDLQTRAILQQMREDELAHATKAVSAGAKILPSFIQKTMGFLSKMMTKTSVWI